MNAKPIRSSHCRTRSSVLLAALGLLHAATATAAQPMQAVADLYGCTSDSVEGTAVLREVPSSEGVKQVLVSVQIFGLAPGSLHATHIHQTAACTPCSAAQGHFDPGPESNTSPDGNHPFHAGDLPNLRVNSDGIGVLNATTSRVTLSPGPLSLFDDDGSALIIHVGSDTYCPEGVVAGCAGGARAACGVIRQVRNSAGQ